MTLLTQIYNEWRSNSWLVMQFAIIAAALFVVVAVLFSTAHTYAMPEGYNGHGTYMVEYMFTPTSAPGYIPEDTVPGEKWPRQTARRQALAELIQRIKSRPEVDAVGFGTNGMPYNYNYWGQGLTFLDVDSISPQGAQCYPNTRWMDPEFVRLMNITGARGESPAQMAAIIARGDMLVSANLPDALGQSAQDGDEALAVNVFDLVGHRFMRGRDSTNVYRLGGVCLPMKRNEYEPPVRPTMIVPAVLDEGAQIVLRLKDGVDGSRFVEQFVHDIPSLYTVGNLYVTDIADTDSLIDRNQVEVRKVTLNSLVCLVFLCVSIFLGILGTFWFRTQTRVAEIAVREAFGARRGDIMGRLCAEGLIIVGVSLPCAAALVWLVDHYGVFPLTGNDNDFFTLGWTAAITLASLLLMVTAGIAIPARKAMHISPAAALKDE